MMTNPDITSDRVRQHLLDRAAAYSQRTRRKFSHISMQSVKDSKFLGRVEAGGNFTIETYQKVIDWLDEQERQPERVA